MNESTVILVNAGYASIVTAGVFALLWKTHKEELITDRTFNIIMPILVVLTLIITGALATSIAVTTLKGTYRQADHTIRLPELKENLYQPWGAEFNDEDEHCLALNIYFEARGEDDVRGKYAVADVVMYRVMHANYPDTVCEVVQDGYYTSWKPDLPVRNKCQFSWWCDGKSDLPLNTASFNEAIDISKEVLHESTYEPRVDYSLFYHSVDVAPSWSKKLNLVERIGNHSFYR